MKYLLSNNFEMIVTALVTMIYMYNLLSTETIVPVGNQLDQSVAFRKIIDCTDSTNGGNCFKNLENELVRDFTIPNKLAQNQWVRCLDGIGDTDDISLLLKIQNCYHQADLVKHAIDTNNNGITNKNVGWFWKSSIAFNLVIQIAIVLYLVQASDNHQEFRDGVKKTIETLTDTIKGVDRQAWKTVATTTGSDIGFNYRIKEIVGRLSNEGDIGGDLETLFANHSAVQRDLNMLKVDYFTTTGRHFVMVPPNDESGTGTDQDLDSPMGLDESGLPSTPSSPPTPSFSNLPSGFPLGSLQVSPIENNQPKIEELKIEELKIEELKVEELKVEESEVEESKVEESKTDEQKIDEPKADEQKIDEPKADEPKADEQKADEQKIAEQKIAEPKIDESKVAEQKIEESKVDESKVDESKIEEPQKDLVQKDNFENDLEKIDISHEDNSQKNKFKVGPVNLCSPKECDSFDNSKLTTHPATETPSPRPFLFDEDYYNSPKLNTPTSAHCSRSFDSLSPSDGDSPTWKIRYRDINKVNPSNNKKYRRVMVPHRGWMSIKAFEDEEKVFGTDNFIINQSQSPTLSL